MISSPLHAHPQPDLGIPRPQCIVLPLPDSNHTPMPPHRRETSPIRLRPPICRQIPINERPIPVTPVIIQQQIRPTRVLIVQITRRPLRPLPYNAIGPTRPRPRSEQAGRGRLVEDAGRGLVLYEAPVVLPGSVEGEDVEVDDGGGGVVYQCLRGSEGLEVGGVGVADYGVGRGAGAGGVGGGVLALV